MGWDGPCGGVFVVQVSPSGGCGPCVVRFSFALLVSVGVAGFSGIDRGPRLSARVVPSTVSDWLLRLGPFVGLCSACCRRVSSSLVWEVSLYLFSVRALVAGVSCTVTAWIATGAVRGLVIWLVLCCVVLCGGVAYC